MENIVKTGKDEIMHGLGVLCGQEVSPFLFRDPKTFVEKGSTVKKAHIASSLFSQ